MKQASYAYHLSAYAWVARRVRNRNVVELGSNEGYGSQLLSVFAKSITGYDISPRGVSRSAMKQHHCAAKFNVLDLEMGVLPLEGVDVVVALEVLEHLHNPQHVLKQISDAGVELIFSIPHNAPQRLHFQDFYSLEDAKALIEPFFSDVEWFFMRHNFIQSAPFKEPNRYIGVARNRMV